MSDINCPKCGAGTQWSCHGDVGMAHCHESGATSRMTPRGWAPTCDWSGDIVRADDGSGVRLAGPEDAARIEAYRQEMVARVAAWQP